MSEASAANTRALVSVAPNPRGDEVSLSAEGLAALANSNAQEPNAASSADAAVSSEGESRGAGASSFATLTPEEEKVVRELKARDREVRAHEQAHKAAAGDLATSGPTYTYQRGPDGVQYAVGGEVGISTAEGRTPEETLERAQRIQRAALAPAEPSGQDRAVAAQAAQMAAQARAEIQSERTEEASGSESEEGSPITGEQNRAIEAYSAVTTTSASDSILDLFG